MNNPEQYKAEVHEVFSGDDLIVMLDLGVDNLFKRVRFRLHGVDTPNAMGRGAGTDADKVRRYVQKLCLNKQVAVRPVQKTLNYWVGVLEVVNGDTPHNLNDDLIAQGFIFKREKK